MTDHDPIDDLIPHYSSLFDPDLLTEYERRSLERRMMHMRRYARQLVEASRTLDRPGRWQAPAGTDAPPRENPFWAVAEEIARDSKPELKRGVLRRMMDKAGRHYMWNNLSSLPVFHELSVLGPWFAVRYTPTETFRQFADFLFKELFNGIVVSLQRAREEVLASREVYFAHCACRSAGVVDDLERDGEVFTLLGEAQNRRLLDRILDRYASLDHDRLRRTTDTKFRNMFDDLARLRDEGSPEYSAQTLLRRTYPDWELIPIHDDYTSRWARSMNNNHKAHPIDRELAAEMLNLFFFSRGAVFNSMKAVDSPYCICVCPSPETDGGCVLTNWYYFGRLNHSMLPADDHHGRRRDDRGQIQPCRYFPVRNRRECIGCGCLHTEDRPRGLDAALAEADAVFPRPGARSRER